MKRILPATLLALFIGSPAWAASPTVQECVVSKSGTSNITNHPVTMPSGIVAGDLLKVFFVNDVSTATTFPAGWTKFYDQVGAGSLVRLGIAWREADGTEGASITVTTAVAENSVSIACRITGHIDPDTQPPEAGADTDGTSTTPDPPSLTPTGGSKDYLWFAVVGIDNRNRATGFPTNYVGTLTDCSHATCSDDNAAGVVGIGLAYRQLTASSEDPGTFTITSSTNWNATTTVVHPAAAAPASRRIIIID